MLNQEPSGESKEYSGIVKKLLAQLNRLPLPLRQNMEKELNDILQLIENKRSPRFIFVGRRGAGKTTLINAIFGEKVGEIGHVKSQTGASSWKTYIDASGKKIDVLDTRGVQEGSQPIEADAASSSEESIISAIQEICPDAFLFLVKAKEVDSAIDGDLNALALFIQAAQDAHNVTPPVVGIITQCDELDPPGIWLESKADEPEIWQEKMGYVQEAIDTLRAQLDKHQIGKEATIVPVAAYLHFKPDGTITPSLDRRWQIDKLVELLIEKLPLEAQLDFARLAKVRQHQRKVARRIVEMCSSLCGFIGMEPIPLADLPILTSIQIMMVMIIAYISGRDLSWQTAQEFLGAAGIQTGAAYTLREGVRALAKLIPGLGNAISGSVAALGTILIGNIAIFYFIDGTDIEKAKAAAKLNAV